MKKQKIQMIIVFVLLILCIGGYYFVTHTNLEDEEQEVNVATIHLTQAEGDSIVKLAFLYKGEPQTYVKENDIWYFDDDRTLEISQSDLKNMISYICSISPGKVISDPSDLSEYGLDNPQNVISFETTDGGVQTLYIGDYFDMDGTNFARVDGDDNVYTVASYYANTFEKNVSDLIVSEDVQEESEE